MEQKVQAVLGDVKQVRGPGLVEEQDKVQAVLGDLEAVGVVLCNPTKFSQLSV